MQVIIMTSYGNERLPKEFKADYSNPLWRMDNDLINRIESKDWILVDDYMNINSRTSFYKINIENGVKYVYPTPNGYLSFITFEIVDVDISRPWCVEEYDGSEYIKYLDDYMCINKELNYFKSK